MTQRIWKYTLTTTSDNTIEMPIGARTKRAVNSLTVERGPKVVPHE